MKRPLVYRLLPAILALAAAATLAGPSYAGGAALRKPSRDAEAVTQLIVKLRSGAIADEALARAGAAHGVKLAKLRDMALGAGVFRIDRALSVEAAQSLARTLEAMPEIEYAEPDRRMLPMAAPSDPLYGSQWHYFDPDGGINLEPAWAISKGAGVVVAVIDTGYRPHVDLAANVVAGYDLISSASRARDGNGRDADARDEGDWTRLLFIFPIDSSWHGTHVAGTIAAVTNNGIGVAGVAPDAKVMPVRALGKDGGSTSDVADGIVWAAGGNVPGVPRTATPARVINMSLGGSGDCSNAMQNAIDDALARGALTVVAAGNDGGNAGRTYPASCDGVVTVAAVGRDGGRASYSNTGAVVEIAAPGGDGGAYVWSTSNSGQNRPANDDYAGSPYQGTSMATPHVAGVAALMLAKNPSLTPARVSKILQQSARPFPARCEGCGAGIVDAAAALQATPAP
jgi:serine protease